MWQAIGMVGSGERLPGLLPVFPRQSGCHQIIFEDHVNPEQQAAWDAWVAERPLAVQERAKQYPPGDYVLLTTGQRVRLYSYEENEAGECQTCSVLAHNTNAALYLGDENPEDAVFKVFGISFNDLIPAPDDGTQAV